MDRSKRGRNYCRPVRSRLTDLFTVFSGTVSEGRQVKQFLLHRMGNPHDIEFDVLKMTPLKDRSKGCIMVQICFQSYNKASKARYLLNNSNRNTSSKIYSYFKEAEAIGAEVNSTKNNESEAIKAIKQIVETAERVVGKHNAKISDMQACLKETEAKLTQKRGVALDVFEALSNEKLAREDKLHELESQTNEFRNYIQSMKKKIVALCSHKKFEAEIREVRKAFGVECTKLEHALPIYARREDILNTIKCSQVTVVLGETGSGKSTQMVQYLYQAGFAEKGFIACTQPRKIAATSLATHVALEMASRVGQEVGYQVGMQSKKTSVTKVLFMTDHILLNECLRDNDLSAYSCIIIDEAHERSIFTDLLIGMLKKCLGRRPDLRVVITSATIDPAVFVSYFGGPEKCPVLSVSGRAFPVEIVWESDSYYGQSFPEDYERKALNRAVEIHKDTKVTDGDILVFLTSQVEIERCCERFKAMVGENSCNCLPLHGRLKAEEQQLVFAPNSPGKRKVVFATNSAETSITIDGIKFVVDTGVVKQMKYDPKRNMNSLDVVPVSQSSANQRKGRAGRTAPGICHRLYSQADYRKMDRTGCPEILRIHLGQAILKLMELNVNPMSFDFVNSPAPEAMETAFQTLIEVGAVSEATITDLGKWIAKIPVEPRLGAMIKKGIDADIPIEALIIAGSCNQGGIFYRAGSKEDKKEADLKKVRFCHKGGDLLTVLNVYREWDKINEKAKGSWCQKNYVNGKSMKGVREMVKEILTILQKECNLKIKYELKEDEDTADKAVQKLLFNSYKSNVSFYLGHEKAGYITAMKHQHVQIHPSSCLHSLALHPTWVVFSQLLKTSDDFITNITPVSEEDIDEAISNKVIKVNKGNLAQWKVERVWRKPVGRHVYWKFVGPMHQNRREIESNIQAICNDTIVVIEADKLKGEISLYCTDENKEDAIDMLEDAFRPLPESLLLESREEPIGHDRSGVRALLREGCGVVDILMPGQFRSVNIKQKDFCRYELTEENVQDLFSQYGDVENIWRPYGKKSANSIFWGKVTFVHEADAITAVEEINGDGDSDFTLEPIKNDLPGARPQEFTIKLKWCRRPGRGFCYVYLDRPEDTARLFSSVIAVNDRLVSVNRPKETGKADLYLRGLNIYDQEDDIKEALAEKLGITLDRNSNRFKVIIPRLSTAFEKNEMERVTEILSGQISRYVDAGTYKIHVKDYKPQTVMCMAFVKFQNPQECQRVAENLVENGIHINTFSVDVVMEFQTSVFVSKHIYAVTKSDIDDFIEERQQKKSSTTVRLRRNKNGDTYIEITATSPMKLAKVKLVIDAIVEGDVLEVESKANVQALFTIHAKQKKHEFEKESGTIITINDRKMKVTVHGLMVNRIYALQLLDDYIAQVGNAPELEIALKGENNPPGLMKALLKKYGYKLAELKSETGLLSTNLNMRDHILAISGMVDALKKAEEAIRTIKEELLTAMESSVIDSEQPDCPICLCPVEASECYRLEYCGHSYCHNCLIDLMVSAIKDRNFPIQCAAEDCGKSIVIRDLYAQIKGGAVKKKEFVESAISCFVSKNKLSYKYCITPDCDMVYKVTSDGTPFNCFQCHARICTTCHIPFHDGLTCNMYKAAKSEENTLKAWIRAKPENRRKCPSCEVGIEKIEGCDNVKCRCGVHICWKCSKHFPTSQECYGHLAKSHGSFV